jgi:hypothetical protein
MVFEYLETPASSQQELQRKPLDELTPVQVDDLYREIDQLAHEGDSDRLC